MDHSMIARGFHIQAREAHPAARFPAAAVTSGAASGDTGNGSTNGTKRHAV